MWIFVSQRTVPECNRCGPPARPVVAQDIDETIFPYLTTVAVLKLEAQTFEADVLKLSCNAG